MTIEETVKHLNRLLEDYRTDNQRKALNTAIKILKQKSKTGHCKECKYFEHDSIVAEIDGIPFILHNICSRWGRGCKTKEEGYCFLFELQESEEE